MKSWKTTIGGILTLAATVFNIATTGAIGPQDVAAITGGIGLIFAKDHNVTGGTTQQ
jgi:hypothetical protein